MQSHSAFIKDLLKLGGNALSDFLETQKGATSDLRKKSRTVADSLDLVTRDEFDTALAFIAKIRAKQDDLEKRLKRLEEKSNLSSTTRGKKTASRRLRSVKHIERMKRRD